MNAPLPVIDLLNNVITINNYLRAVQTAQVRALRAEADASRLRNSAPVHFSR